MFEDLYVTDLQPPDPGSSVAQGGLVAFVDSEGRINAPALVASKPNVFVIQPLVHRTLGHVTPGGVNTAIARAWKRRHVFLKRTAAGSVMDAARSVVSVASSHGALPKLAGQRSHRGSSMDFGDPMSAQMGLGSALQPIVDEDSESSSEELEDGSTGDGSGGGGSGGVGVSGGQSGVGGLSGMGGGGGTMRGSAAPAWLAAHGGGQSQLLRLGRRPVIRLVDGREFPASGRPPMFVVSLTMPPKHPDAEADIEAWAEKTQAYRRSQVSAWSSGLGVTPPSRDMAPTDVISGPHINIQSDSMSFVHCKRFEDELKGAIDTARVCEGEVCAETVVAVLPVGRMHVRCCSIYHAMAPGWCESDGVGV